MVAIKKYDYEKMCDDLGYTYLYEKNPKLWLKDCDGFEHCINRKNFSKGVKPNIKTALNKKEYFLHNACKKHNDLFEKSNFDKFEYIGASVYTVATCKIHGDYRTKPNWILSRGHHCLSCANDGKKYIKLSNTDEFINKALQKHGDVYDYSLVDYKNARNHVKIVCKEHGVFEQVPYYHLSGNGCQICGISKGGYGRNDYMKSALNGSNVYLLEIENHNEMFYKIGISKNLRGRVNSIKMETGYNIKILSKFFISSSGIAYDLEFLLHELFKEFSYKPMILFAGYTECFKYIDMKEFEYLLNHAKEVLDV